MKRCCYCYYWNPVNGPVGQVDNVGYCEVFNKHTNLDHGVNCTAWQAVNANTSGGQMTTQTRTEYILVSLQTGDEIMTESSLEDALKSAAFAGRSSVRIIERVIRTETEEREVSL